MSRRHHLFPNHFLKMVPQVSFVALIVANTYYIKIRKLGQREVEELAAVMITQPQAVGHVCAPHHYILSACLLDGVCEYRSP